MTDTAYDRAFKGRLVLFSIMLVIFIPSLFLSLYYPSSIPVFRYRYGYYNVEVSGFFVILGGYRLIELHRQHEKFKNTGYTYPYPENAEP